MDNDRNAEILALIGRLSREIEVARNHALDHTARLLQIAILDLRTIVASISDDDLRDLTDALYDEFQAEKLSRLS